MVDYPENDFTRMIEMTNQENRSGVRRNIGVASATPMPTVQSAAVGRPVEDEAPLTAEERAELDKAAIAAGVRDWATRTRMVRSSTSRSRPTQLSKRP
jgi:hypothetical protein